MKATRNILTGLLFATGLIAGFYFLHAQDATTAQSGTFALTGTNIDWNSISDAQIELMAIEMVPPIPYAQLPESDMAGGTFWSAQHSPLSPEPWPPLPADIMQLAVWSLGTNSENDGVFLLDDTNVDYTALAQSNAANNGVRVMDENSGGAFSPDFSFPAGSLWLQINNVSNGLVYLTLNGTTNGVEYQILSQDALSNAPMSSWNSEGLFWGSATTNWTATTVSQNGRTNLFMAARSWADSTGGGIPDWWWLLYYGQTTNVNPYTDSAGDGWNNLEKFQFGMNPTNFYTPPTPQGLTAVFDSANSAANVSWLPSPGPVTGYTVQKYDEWTGQTTNFNFSTGVDGFPDAITDSSGEKIDFFTGDYGPTIPIHYQIQAHYSGGDSAWSAPVLLEPNYQAVRSYQSTLPIELIGGPQGTAYLAASALPSGTVALRIKRVDEYANINFGNSSFDTTVDIPLSASTNGLYLLSDALTTPGADSYGQSEYTWYVQTVDINDNPSEPMPLNQVYSSRAVPAYFDGREQLKQNLIFELRMALTSLPFQFTELYSGHTVFTSYPTNFAYAGFYQFDSENNGTFNTLLPFVDNYRYRNFVFSLSDVDSTGLLPSFTNSFFYSGEGLGLNEPPAYQFQPPATNGAAIAPLLATNGTRWVASGTPYEYPVIDNLYEDPEIGFYINYTDSTMYLAQGVQNIYGLPFLSIEVAWGNSGSLTLTLYPQNETTQTGWLYSETAQPQFQTKEYDFWNPNLDALPGMTNFVTTNTSRLMITAVGNPNFQVVGYAKLAVQNGYPGVYAYLGQYFTNADQINTNGAATTNTTGVLSPYGNFFATVPGPAALVTMPDPDTGQRGTCTVYAISLALDANHGGVINTNFGGPDGTSQANPYVFWVNNNSDGLASSFGGDTYQDDVDTPGAPDYNYVDGLTHERAIPETRDLEDFARLWACGVTSNLLAALPAGSTVTLNWGDVDNPNSANPTIDLFQAADPDGGIGYLTNETVANEQVNSSEAGYLGQLGPGSSILLNASTFTNNWAGNHFIWCGASNGVGQLNLTIMDASNNVLAQASQWIQIEDIKQMYERWTVGDAPSQPPMTTPVPAADDLPTNVMQLPFRYATNTVPNTPYILFVHGWNEDYWLKDRRAEVAFKRLYWQGYQGRFGEFRWPTTSGDNWFTAFVSMSSVEDDYNWSEYRAWQSGTGLLNLLTSLDAEYQSGHVYLLAHSLGNVVAGEALRLAGTSQVVNTYVASQVALTAHLYDSTVPDTIFSTIVTPDVFNNWLAGINGHGAGQVFNYYNTNDYVLGATLWEKDQADKPSQADQHWGPYSYLGTPYTESSPQYTPGSVDDSYPWRGFRNLKTVLDISASVTNYYEVMANASQPRATALGITAGVKNIVGNVNLTKQGGGIWPPDPYDQNYSDFLWHSGEFVNDNSQQQGYWQTLLHSTTEGFGL